MLHCRSILEHSKTASVPSTPPHSAGAHAAPGPLSPYRPASPYPGCVATLGLEAPGAVSCLSGASWGMFIPV